MTKLYKDGDQMGIETNCIFKQDFIDQFSDLLSTLIDNKNFETDWFFQLSHWLRDYTEVLNKMILEIGGIFSSGTCGGEPFASILDDGCVLIKGKVVC